MSDFISDFGHTMWRGSPSLASLRAFLLLWTTARKKVAAHSDNTTGHVWDENLAEMNNPLPRWWVWLFVITLILVSAIWRRILAWGNSVANWVGPSKGNRC